MSGTPLGALKVAARKAGVSVAEYAERDARGEKWCTRCKKFEVRSEFGIDNTRYDGLAAHCLKSRRTGRPTGVPLGARVNPVTGRPGPSPAEARHGDVRQARARINKLVRTGRLPRPNDLPCADCRHVHSPSGRRHEYDHYLGYGPDHHLDVEAVCTSCHAAREKARRGK